MYLRQSRAEVGLLHVQKSQDADLPRSLGSHGHDDGPLRTALTDWRRGALEALAVRDDWEASPGRLSG